MSNVTDIAVRRVERVKALARKVAGSVNGDREAFDQLKRCVSSELVNQGSIEVASGAMEALRGEEAEIVLQSAVLHANRVFPMEDRILCAVVVPVAIRYESSRQDAVKVWHGNVNSMKVLAHVVKKATGALAVGFDARFYRAGDLLGARAREMRDHLLAIESGEVQQKGLAKAAEVKSGPESSWEMVYFLGMAAFEPGKEGNLQLPEVEEAMRRQIEHAEWAMDQADGVAWAEGVRARAQCLGYFSMHRGIKKGEDRLRELHLDSMVSNMELGVTGTLFQYAEDAERDRIRLLITTNVESAECIWKRFGDGGDGAFRRALKEVISNRVADVRDIQKLQLDEYKAIAARKGIVW